jgi:hypothetical protein
MSSLPKHLQQDHFRVSQFAKTSEPNMNLNIFSLLERKRLLGRTKEKLMLLQRAVPNLEENIRDLEDDATFHSAEGFRASSKKGKRTRKGRRSRKTPRRSRKTRSSRKTRRYRRSKKLGGSKRVADFPRHNQPCKKYRRCPDGTKACLEPNKEACFPEEDERPRQRRVMFT